MAPKRSAPPPPPLPPAASSEETASGSGSEESEEEEEIAYSPPPAAPKMTAPLLRKGPESEGSEEEQDDDEEGEEEEDDEEEEKNVNHVAPPPASNNPSPPPPKREESETSGDDEEEETDDEAPETKPAPIHGPEGKGSKPLSGEDKKPGAPFQRTWSTDDEVRILEAMVAHRQEHGTLPQADALAAALAGSLDNSSCSPAGLQGKINALKRRYNKANKKGELPTKDHDRRLYDLSKSVWGSAAAAAANDGARREFDEMCELYPFLAEEVKALQRAHNGTFKREFEMMDDDKARALDAKIKRQRVHEMKLHRRRQDLNKELNNTLIDLVEHYEGVHVNPIGDRSPGIPVSSS